MKQFPKTMRFLSILLIACASPMGGSPSLAMNPPSPVLNAPVTYPDFIANQGPQLGQQKRMPNDRQKQTIENFFRNSSGKSQDILFNEIDALLVPDKKIVGEQAAALKRYVRHKMGAPVGVPQGQQAGAPQGQTEADLLAWTKIVAEKINVYFSQPYQTAPNSPADKILNCNAPLKNVERPNHGLAHGLRQGLISLDIVDELNKHADSFQHADAKQLAEWVRGKIKTDPNFRKKVIFAAAFQRTGRISETDNPDSFKPKDAANFYKEALPYVGAGKLFNSTKELEIFRDALSSAGKPQISIDSAYLNQIFYGSHWLDLRRLVYGGNTSFQHEAAAELFNTGGGSTNELDDFIKILWDRVGKYLEKTGDRDGDLNPPRKYNYHLFCELSNNPAKMVQALFSAR